MQGFAVGNQGLVLTLERHFPHAARLAADDFIYISILLPTDSTK